MEGAPCLVLQPQEDLPTSTVVGLLLNPEGQELCKVPPVRPKAGQVFLFVPEKQHAKGYFNHACIYYSKHVYEIKTDGWYVLSMYLCLLSMYPCFIVVTLVILISINKNNTHSLCSL